MKSTKYIEDTEDFYQYAPCGFLTCDITGSIAGINATLLKWTDRSREETEGVCTFSELLTVGSRLFAETHIMPLLKMQGYVNEVSLEMRGKEGRSFPALVSARRSADGNGGQACDRFTVIDYTMRKRFERELIEAKRGAEETAEKLLRANRDLERFAHIASHDLQAPLNSVAGLIEILKVNGTAHPEAGPEPQEIFEMIGSNILRMKAMIRDLLAYRPLDAGPAPMQQVKLGVVCAEAAENLRADMDLSGAVLQISNTLPEVRGVPIRLVRLFQNLFSNALKYRSEATPRVEVNGEKTGDRVLIAVSDNGIGFDPGDAEKIFGFMERLQSRDEVEGTGIGLSACRRIAEMHGGRIWAESIPGKGSTFFLDLPAA